MSIRAPIPQWKLRNQNSSELMGSQGINCLLITDVKTHRDGQDINFLSNEIQNQLYQKSILIMIGLHDDAEVIILILKPTNNSS